MYRVYTKHKNYKRAMADGVITDSYDAAVRLARIKLESWWGINGVYEWVKIKDLDKNKYVATFQN